MVVLSPRFSLLAAITVLAAFPNMQEAEAAVIHDRQPQDGYTSPYRAYSRRFSHPHTRSVHRRQETPAPAPSPASPEPQAPAPPTLSLPIIGRSNVRTEGASGSSVPPQQVDKRYDPFGPLLQLGRIWIGDKPAPKKRNALASDLNLSQDLLKRYSSKIEQSVEHSQDMQAERQQAQSNSQSSEGMFSGASLVGEKIYRRQPHKHEHEEKIFFSGDYDTVNLENRSDAASLSRRVVAHQDAVGIHIKRDQSNGVAGRVDIMSPVANTTSAGQKIASLLLSSTTADGNYQAGMPFVLNASGTNSTQMYLVTQPDPEPDSSGAAPSDSTAASSASNSTTSGSSSSNSTTPSFVKVSLQIPMFNSEDASMKSYCATFDPKPVQPAPLFVDKCMEPGQTAEHQSQIFAYEPSTGVIRPMWFDGEDDGTGTQDAQDVDGDGDEDDNDGDASSDLDSPGTNSTSGATQDPATPGSSKIASVTSAMALDSQYGDATRPPNMAHSFAAVSNSSTPSNTSASINSTTTPTNARNVTMVFVPAAPQIVSPQRAEAMGMDPNPTSDGDFNSTVPSTSLSASASPSATAAAYDYSSSYAASATDLPTASYTSASATSTDASAADFDDGYDSYSSASATATSSTAAPTASSDEGLSAADADFNNTSFYPTASSSYASDTASATSSATSLSAAGFGLAATASSDVSYSSTSATSTATSSVAAAAYDYASSSAAPTPSASLTTDSASPTGTDVSAAAYDATSSAYPTDSISSNATSTYSTSSIAAGPSAAAFDVSTSSGLPTSTITSDASSSTAASGISAEAAATPTSSTDATPSSHTLGVEVYDPDMSSIASASSTPTVGAQDVDASSSADPSAASSSASSSASATTASSASATMTPVSTTPYKWMFKKDTGVLG